MGDDVGDPLDWKRRRRRRRRLAAGLWLLCAQRPDGGAPAAQGGRAALSGHQKRRPIPGEIHILSFLLSTTITWFFAQARPEYFSGPQREFSLRCESSINEHTWRAERRAALTGLGGNQRLRHEEPYSSAAASGRSQFSTF